MVRRLAEQEPEQEKVAVVVDKLVVLHTVVGEVKLGEFEQLVQVLVVVEQPVPAVVGASIGYLADIVVDEVVAVGVVVEFVVAVPVVGLVASHSEAAVADALVAGFGAFAIAADRCFATLTILAVVALTEAEEHPSS